MSKRIAEETKKIRIKDLVDNDVFKNGKNNRTIEWSYGDETTDTAHITAFTAFGRTAIHVKYRTTIGTETKGQNQNYDIDIITTPCHFGGYRRWFICPTCRTKHTVLFMVTPIFQCRECSNIAYESQNYSHFQRQYGRALRQPDVDEILNTVKRFYYNGKPTKTYQKYLDEQDRHDLHFMLVLRKLTRT